jgi:hypothetical protein
MLTPLGQTVQATCWLAYALSWTCEGAAARAATATEATNRCTLQDTATQVVQPLVLQLSFAATTTQAASIRVVAVGNPSPGCAGVCLGVPGSGVEGSGVLQSIRY